MLVEIILGIKQILIKFWADIFFKHQSIFSSLFDQLSVKMHILLSNIQIFKKRSFLQVE